MSATTSNTYTVRRGNVEIKVINTKPTLEKSEEAALRQNIENALYAVFAKYHTA